MGFLREEQEHTHQTLQVYVDGLGEYVRVTRFITATIGDLLMLEPSALLTIDTLSSSWCSIALVSEALEIEKLWKIVEGLGLKLGLKTKNETSHPLDSLTEIRTSRSENYDPSQLDQFTLQRLPTRPQASTLSTVQWEGKPFMACSANFLARKCAFYVVNG